MKVVKMCFFGVVVIELQVFGDVCGFFYESYNEVKYCEVGIDCCFVQFNVLCLVCGVLCGLYYQWLNLQGKLVSVLEGEVYDVVVDICCGLFIFGQWIGVMFIVENYCYFWIFEGFVYGFCVVLEYVIFVYQCMVFYDVKVDVGICWNDFVLGIDWLIGELLLFDKDSKMLLFVDVFVDCLLDYIV